MGKSRAWDNRRTEIKSAEPAKSALSANPKKDRRKYVAIAPRGVEAANIARYFLQSVRGRLVFNRDTANATEVGAALPKAWLIQVNWPREYLHTLVEK